MGSISDCIQSFYIIIKSDGILIRGIDLSSRLDNVG